MMKPEELHTRYRLPIRSWDNATEAIRAHGERISKAEGKLLTLTAVLAALIAQNAAIIVLIVIK